MQKEVVEPYRIIDHESDIGFEVQAHTLEELFRNASEALFSIIVENVASEPDAERRFTIPSEPDSLVVFLNELLYLWDTDKFVPSSVDIAQRETSLEIDTRGILLQNDNRILGSVKAVTYHKFSVTERDGLLKATFIVDV
ncbi:MAG TPA: archease [Syntrophorhabdaceae bacterium]|nr:archease [Syntrophorhabdaceae bacterium]